MRIIGAVASQTATPGFANSVLKLDDDLAIESFQIADTLSATGLSAGFIVTVYNHGRQVASGFAINVYADRNLVMPDRRANFAEPDNLSDLEPDSGMSVLGASYSGAVGSFQIPGGNSPGVWTKIRLIIIALPH
jgi:hypothetical protein